MFSDATESKCGSLFDRGVKLFEAVNKSVKSTRVNNGFCKGGGVFGNGSQNVGGGFLVEALN
jgi:hypothetical protein